MDDDPLAPLLSWSASRPTWQQDALRRMATQNELDDTDISSLRQNIEAIHGLLTSAAPAELLPLSSEHFVDQNTGNPVQRLASLGPVNGIDQLAEDQNPLRFAREGVTLVYGPNGSGKSGYCRITKLLCQSRSATQLRGNVYFDKKAKQEVSLRTIEDGSDDAIEHTWTPSEGLDHRLIDLLAYDSMESRVYVDSNRGMSFIPRELSLLGRLAKLCQLLEGQFKREKSQLSPHVPSSIAERLVMGTDEGSVIAALKASDSLDGLPSEERVSEATTWSEENQQELDRLERAINSDPALQIKRYTTTKESLTRLWRELDSVYSVLSSPAIENYGELQKAAYEARRNAEAAMTALRAEEPSPDIAEQSKAWRQMLRYAQEYASELFPDATYHLHGDGHCVLCRQSLSVNARDRMSSIEDFVVGQAETDARNAEKALSDAISRVRSVRIPSVEEVQASLSLLRELDKADRGLLGKVIRFVRTAARRRECLLATLDQNFYVNNLNLPQLLQEINSDFEERNNELGEQIQRLQATSIDEEQKRQLNKRRDALRQRKLLAENREQLLKVREDKEKYLRLESCQTECKTQQITRHLTSRAREVLTPTLEEFLSEELDALKLSHLPLQLADRGSVGESLIEVQLNAQDNIRNNSEVLSEGEQNALGLGCFLAELREVGDGHGIIVDDPVSSLDHDRMQAVARRLVKHAQDGRQIIVFTHNILFHHMVLSECGDLQVPLHQEWVSSIGAEQFGIVDHRAKPWHAMKVKQRVDEISKLINELEQQGFDQNERWRSEVVDVYTKLRTTWEATVEEVLFARVVERFRPDIQTQRLQAACFNPEEDYLEFCKGMKRCSHYSGHELAADLAAELPGLEEMRSDLEALNDFISRVSERNKRLDKNKQALTEPPKATLV